MSGHRRVLKRPANGWARTRGERVDAYLSGFFPLLMLSVLACVLGISVFGATVETLNQLILWG
jgi:hypothetical protein